MSSPGRDELDEALDDEASLFGSDGDQEDQGGQEPMQVEEEEEGPVVSLGAFSAQAAAAAAAAAGRRQRAPSRSRGSPSNGPGYSMGEVGSESESEAEKMWRIANTSGGNGEDDASADGTSVQGDNPGGADLRQVRHPSLTSTDTFDTSILCNEDVLAVVFPHSKATNGGWLDYNSIFKRTQADQGTSADGGVADGTAGMIPARAMVFNIPKSAFRPDADRVRDMRSSMTNQSRATNINTLFGLLWTPVAKGWKSGNHVEDHQNARNAQGAAGDDEEQEQQKKKKIEEVDQYMFYSRANGEMTEVPMFNVAYEELYAEPNNPDEEPSEVVAVRFWKIVNDCDHSESELVSRLITENRRRTRHAGAAHCTNATRSNKLMQEHSRAIKLVGGASTENVALEYHAANQYMRVIYPHDLLNLFESYGGKTDTFEGYPPICLKDLPDGALNHPLKGVKKFGGDSYLSPEYVFNAKRQAALEAGLVDFDSTPLNVCHQQREVSSYFDAETGAFKVPDFVAAKSAFWMQTNPGVLHPYDMALPRPIAGIEAPGKELLQLYAEQFENWKQGAPDPTADPGLVNRFKNMCTGIDQTTAKAIREATDSIFSFDGTEVSDADRMVASMAKAGSGKDHVGSFEKGAAVIEQRQVLKQLGAETSTVVRKLIAPWEAAERAALAKDEIEEDKKLAANLASTLSEEARDHFRRTHATETRALKQRYQVLQERHVMYKRELFNWGAEKFLRAFTSRYDRDSIPTGYRAVWDGLYAELKDMPNGSACVAVAEDMQLTDSHKSAYAHAMNFYGRWCEHDCFVRAGPCPF